MATNTMTLTPTTPSASSTSLPPRYLVMKQASLAGRDRYLLEVEEEAQRAGLVALHLLAHRHGLGRRVQEDPRRVIPDDGLRLGIELLALGPVGGAHRLR